MAQVNTIERLSFILNYVYSHHYPTLGQIMKHLENKDLKPTERTFQRDLKSLRDACFIEIKYDRANKGYFINQENEKDFQEWMYVFELFNTSGVINDTLVKSSSNLDYIDFDRSRPKLMNEHLAELLKATINRKKVTFDYFDYWQKEPENVLVQPHLLKQYQNRWYVYGCFESGEFKSFGLERISNFHVLNESFKPKTKRPKEAFDSIIGLNYSESDLETVVLSYDAFQGNYIKSMPLHHSQKILLETEEELRIEIHVKPNYELEEQILKQGERVVVITPNWLREQIKKRLEQAFRNY